jgi:hypothetical protein
MDRLTSIKKRHFALIALPEILALIQSVLRCGPLLAIGILRIHDVCFTIRHQRVWQYAQSKLRKPPKGKQEIRNELNWIRRAQLKVSRSVPYKQACSLNPFTSSTRRCIPAMTSPSIPRMAAPDLPRAFLLL